MRYTLHDIANITGGNIHGTQTNQVTTLLTDSRSLMNSHNVMFVALRGTSGNGHKYIETLIKKGVKSFLVEEIPSEITIYSGTGFVVVANTLAAIQKLGQHHRNRFSCEVIGITGSNGKTIVKEWLNFCLQDRYNITRSPKSYNSQIGVPLSVLQLDNKTELGIFEAGISQIGEMSRLSKIIEPTIGIFTNLGDAHQENFANPEQKLREKIKLFDTSKIIITTSDNTLVRNTICSTYPDKQLFSWGNSSIDNVKVTKRKTVPDGQIVDIEHNGMEFCIKIPFIDNASYQNAMTVITLLCAMNFDHDTIAKQISKLQPVDMRLEMKSGRNNSYIINDSYNSDLVSLESSFEYLSSQNQAPHKIAVVSDIHQSGLAPIELYKKVAATVNFYHTDTFIGVGPDISSHQDFFPKNSKFFETTDKLIEYFSKYPPTNCIILLKGSRSFRFELIDRMLQERQHRTILEVNLDAMIENLRYYRSKLASNTKIIAMIKAFGYGSGSHELAAILQHHRVDYLAVAFTDEAVHLRENGIKMPIIIMNPGVETFPEIIEYKLEPVIYGFDFMNSITDYLATNSIYHYPIHLKIDSGMNRSGFKQDDANSLTAIVKDNSRIRVISAFSHLAAADEPEFDSFTNEQVSIFTSITNNIASELKYNFFRHILNTAGIERFPQYQFDAVRLGIGLYGVSFENGAMVKQVVSLKSQVMQVKHISANETVGYGRNGKVNRQSTIATIPIGYADGYRRILGNGRGAMLVNGQQAHTIGNICMDMCMLDVTDIDVKEGDPVTIFGEGLPITEIAQSMNTIPYEVLAAISHRIKRVYYRQ